MISPNINTHTKKNIDRNTPALIDILLFAQTIKTLEQAKKHRFTNKLPNSMDINSLPGCCRSLIITASSPLWFLIRCKAFLSFANKKKAVSEPAKTADKKSKNIKIGI